ncbi:MAG: lactate permease LctP family transporter [Clostridiales bacterium]|nr:lactate permease LctP family transporter [Clostridiales bacterium]
MKAIMFVLAILPILWLMITLGGSLLKGYVSALTTLGITLVLALAAWKMPIGDALSAVAEGTVLGIWPIMTVIISAIFTYNLARHTGSLNHINRMLSVISTDKRIQVLILAWGFGGFLEAISGYGTSVAIPAGILIALGFEPVFAAVVCLIANTAPTAYGAVGISITTMAKLTGLENGTISFYTAVQLALFSLVLPFVLVAVTSRGIKGLKGVLGITLASGVAFVIPQLLAARYLSEELPTLLGSLCSMGVTILLAKRFHADKRGVDEGEAPMTMADGIKAWLPYILIFVLIMLCSPLTRPIHNLIDRVSSSFLIYTGPGAAPMTIKWIDSPGTLIFISAVAGSMIQGASLREILLVFGRTVRQMTQSIITVLSIVALAKVMAYSGMISTIALMLVTVTGLYFPFISPLLGALGTFVTGSGTTSTVLFGALQKEVADSIHVNPYWLAASNIAGSTVGKMISPQSISVATSSTGITGSEGKIFSRVIKYCVAYVILLGLLVYAGSVFLRILGN